MTSKEESVIPLSTLKLLSDKLYEKRKLGALGIEQMVKKALESNDDKVLHYCFLMLLVSC